MYCLISLREYLVLRNYRRAHSINHLNVSDKQSYYNCIRRDVIYLKYCVYIKQYFNEMLFC